MSVINTMLRDLDQRRAGAVVSRNLLDEVAIPAHTSQPARRLNVLMPMLACGLAATATWFWLHADNHLVNGTSVAHAAATATRALVAHQAAPLVASAQPEVEKPVAASAVAFDEPGDSARGATLVLATSMLDVGSDAPVRSVHPTQAKSVAIKAESMTAPKPELARETPQLRAMSEQPVRAMQAPAAATESAIHVEQSTQTPAERNQAEVQRAADQLRRGSPADAEATLRNVLGNDRGMVDARLALFSLLQRQQRGEEARAVLREGVSLAPTQASLVLPYARLLAARGDWAGAYDALLPAADALVQDAEYRGLCGVVLQRLGRFPQSVAEYRAALKISPAASAWWVGLGLSLEGDGRAAEARGAYLQARATNPGPELAQFVESKLTRLSGAE